MDLEALLGAPVELSAPDGRIFRFRVISLVPYAGATYAVLEHDAEGRQLLVTHIETSGDDAPVFVVAGEADIIDAVLEKQVASAIARALEDAPEQDEDTAPEPPILPPHPVSCTCSRCRRPAPSYIRRWKP